MLGKTNITTLAEGVVVTEIEDFNWIRMQSGLNGNFVKAIYENSCLVAITADGKVAYTNDGEAWQTSNLKYANCKLEDIDWDGNQFLLVGSYKDTVERTDGTSGEYELGFISMTVDFTSFEYIGADTNGINLENSYNYYSKYYAVYPVNGKLVVFAMNRSRFNASSTNSTSLDMLVGDMGGLLQKHAVIENRYIGEIFVGKNSQGVLVTNASGSTGYTYMIDGNTLMIAKKNEVSGITSKLPVFECKDELYYTAVSDSLTYRFVKVRPSGEEILMSTDINYGFVDGVYFNKCRIFINNHEMLILRKSENVADKSLEDLIEIAPENTMTFITKAFGQIFAFGNRGLVLRSSTDGSSEETLLLQAISGKKALLEAKIYTNQLYEQLAARIAALETGVTRETE